MRTEAQRVSTWTNGSLGAASSRLKTDWFVMCPARRGGGDISVDAEEGLALDLVPEFGARSPARKDTARQGWLRWTWPAPGDTQLCRLFVGGAFGDPSSVPDSFVVCQQIEEMSPHEHIVFIADGATYRSKLFQIKKHGDVADDELLVVTDRGARLVPSDPRDNVLTRFLTLQRGVYELRLRWPPGTDLSHVLVRPQYRDYSWLPTTPILDSSDAEVRLVALFDVPEDERRIRFHLVRPGYTVDLPEDVRLVRLMSDSSVATARRVASVPQEGIVNPAAENAVRWLAELADESGLAAVLPSMTEASLERAMAGDRWLHNYAKNAWEFVHRRTVLTTYPPDVCFPIADVCNARCTFCSSWLEGTRIAELEEVDAFEEVFRFARWVGLAGHGEPLAHPHIREILSRLGTWLDERATAYVITNGVYLPGLLDELIRCRVTRFNVSLNAASAAIHREVMGLPEGSFERILESVGSVLARRDSHGTYVGVSMVITRQNLHEVPAFVELANGMGVDRIQLKTLAPVGGLSEGLNYHLLPPYTHPDYTALKASAVDSIGASRVPVQVDTQSWDVPVFLPHVEQSLQTNPVRFVSREEALKSRELREKWRSPPKYQAKTAGRVLDEVLDFDGRNPFGRTAPFACRAPYRYLYINDFSFNLTPCCYLPTVPGAEPVIYGGSGKFMEAWNSEALVALRRRLRDGPLFNTCTKCPGTY